MQSTSVDVVSVNPAAVAVVPGHALYTSAFAGVEYDAAALGTIDIAADALCIGTTATVAQITAKLTSSPLRLLILVSILPPYSFYKFAGVLREIFNFRENPDL